MKKIILLFAIVFLFILFATTGCNNLQKGEIPSIETSSIIEDSDENNEIRVENEPNLGLEKQKIETKIEKNKNDKKIEEKSQKKSKKDENKTGNNTNTLNHEHNYVENIVTPPTCTKKGCKVFTCSGCGSTYYEEISALGHSFNGWTPDKISHSHACNKCGFSETKSHTWNLDGECSVCGVVNFE